MIIYVDDEQASIVKFKAVCKDITDIGEFCTFTNSTDVMEFAKKVLIDIAFLDIEMPELNGIDLAIKLYRLNPNTKIVFITAYDNYALSAYGVNAIGYLLKPYQKGDIISQIEKARRIMNIPQKKVYIQTFPRFDVFVDEKLIHFKSEKAKELLALLVDKVGGNVNNDYAITYLWENKSFNKNTKALYRMTKKTLKDFLNEIGISHIIKDEGRVLAVIISKFSCDYYDILNEINTTKTNFHGEYMFEYSWAEKTLVKIERLLKYENILD